MIRLIPNASPLREINLMHVPAGSPKGGQFAPKTGGGPEGSAKLPPYLKDDVRRALAQGIHTYHKQQPEPVRDITGKLHDPLAMSHANRGDNTWVDAQGFRHYADKGKIFLSTRGGEYEPYEQTYYSMSSGWNPQKEQKKLSPADLKRPASEHDVVSVFRHEMGHLLRRSFRGTTKTPHELASEISAWQYAIEATPNHRVSQRLMATGLLSHAYSVFRVENLRTGDLKRTSRWDFDEVASRTIQAESKRGFVDPDATAKARVFTGRALKALNAYGRVLTAKGLMAAPVPREQSKWTFSRQIVPNSGFIPPSEKGPRGVGW